jgi:hypothetical protein
VDPENSIVTVGVSRWHHAKLNGLFGNMDSEPFNDFTTKEGIRTENKQVFLRSWSIGSSLPSITEDYEKENNATREHRELSCDFLFRCPLSPLARCFRHVDPRPFEKLCRNERLDCNEGDKECPVKRICKAVLVYASHCYHSHTRVQVPRVCHSCSDNNNSIQPASSEKAEVVFIVEDGKQCENSRTIREMAASIKTVYQQRGVANVHFAVVGYNKFPYTHTFKGKIFVEDKDLKKETSSALNLAEYAQRTSPCSAMRAVDYATTLPFQPTSTKQFIMLPCTSCGKMKTHLPTLLQQMGIHFSAVLRTKWTIDSNPSRRYYAMDKVNVYHSAKPMGAARSFSELPSPITKDGCYKLAMASGGLVFDREAEIQPLHRPQFHRFFSMRMTSRARNPLFNRPYTCTCDPTDHFGSRRICQPTAL